MVQISFREIDTELGPRQQFFFFLEGILFLLMTHYVRYLIKTLNWINLPMSRLIPRVVGIVVAMSWVLYLLRALVAWPLGVFEADQFFQLSTFLILTSVFSMIFFIWMVLYFSYHYFLEYNTALKHEAAIKQIELNNLKSQLNPHFIFNALNSIRALVDENPANSKKAITQLSNILRNSLTTDKQRLTSLSDEISVVEDYLGLERIRYEERLHVDMDIASNTLNHLIPPLMIQTLVENGIKHGISKLKKGGNLSVKTELDNNDLRIEIRNSGVLETTNGRLGTGMGIENTKQRLKLIYGPDATFSILEENGTVLTRLLIPKREIL